MWLRSSTAIVLLVLVTSCSVTVTGTAVLLQIVPSVTVRVAVTVAEFTPAGRTTSPVPLALVEV